MTQRVVGVVVGLLLMAGVASAQTTVATGSERPQWNQGASALSVAQGYTYEYTIDTASPVPAVDVQCSGAVSPFACSSAFPAATPGDHAMTLTASTVVTGTKVTSLPSNTLAFKLVVAPTAPANLRLALAGDRAAGALLRQQMGV